MADLRAAMEYAQKNPKSDFARQLSEHLKSGAADQEASQLGIDLSPFGRPKYEAPAVPEEISQPGYIDRVAQTQGSGANKIIESVQRAGQKLSQNDGSALGTLKATGGVLEGVLGAGAGAVETAFAPLSAALQSIMPKPTDDAQATEQAGRDIGVLRDQNPAEAGLSKWIKEHPDAARNLQDILTVGSTVAGGEAGLLGDTVAKTTVKEGLGALATPAVETASALKTGATAVKDAASAAKDVATNTSDKIRTYYANKNVAPQLKTSVERLQADAPLIGAGAARQKGLVEVYDDFAKQEAKHISDIKQDPAISKVGENIGDEFRNVVKMRRDAGKQMQEALKENGTIKVDANDAISSFNNDLADSGLTRNGKNELTTGPESKVNEADKSLLERYDSEINKLGANPTVGQLDAMISRVSSDLDLYKSKNNILGTTNGERIIKKNLDALRNTIDSEKGNLPQLAGYSKAKKTYSTLSKFIEEGEKHLGKLTQSGDYARDASLAKSSVQSVLNNGKKDWLIELENLTGYPALDEATLALQAMKDAGDFKGNSLLELLTDGATRTEAPSIPHNFSALLIQAAKAGYKTGKGKVLGTPAEQTRAFLKSIEEAKKNR